MIFNQNRLCAIIIISVITPSTLLLARLTTLQHYDPIPVFSANDSMMPPNSQFLDLKQAQFKNEQPNKRRVFGFNISGFIQGSNRAKGYTGATDFGTVVGIPENGFEMGDFRGTLYTMGVFLGKNPNNGNSIWASGVDNGDATNITDCSIRNFGLPSCLTDIAEHLSGNTQTFSPTPCSSTPPSTGLVFNSTTTASNTPSIFSESALANDTKYFGAFSMPIEYRKQGLRLELNANIHDNIGITIQTGVVNLKQTFANSIATTVPSATGSPIGQTTAGPYSISNVQTACTSGSTGCTNTTISPLYQNLNNQAGTGGGSTTPTPSQIIFNKYICNNLDNILNPECGLKQSLCPFDEYGLEDIRFILTLQNAYAPNHYRQKDQDQQDSWPDMIFTPYIWGGGTFPVSDTVNYYKLLALPFGNNGHASVGTGVGMTFDFAESVEVGFEGGMTYFFCKNETRPFPTHNLQRILYPFATNVDVKPGINWHVKALLQAYQFLKHVSFWFTYELVEHRKDCYKVTDVSKKEYFVPSVLECLSDWRGQFFNAALVFDIQPGIQASFLWQQPISPRNAYYPVTIMGSINFMF